MKLTRWLRTRTPEELARDARALFRSQFSLDPAGVWAAPGRVNVIGDHVDYAGGVSIPFALTQLTAVAAAPREDATVTLVSALPDGSDPVTAEVALDKVGPGSPADWSGYAVGVIWAALEAGTISRRAGLDIAIVSDVPVGSGLSSSAALECAVAVAAYELSEGHAPDRSARAALASACMRAENEVVGASTGGLDQRASLFGEAGKALVIDFHSDEMSTVPFPGTLLIADTNAPHTLSDGQYASRRGVIDEVTEGVLGPGATLREGTDMEERAVRWAARHEIGVDTGVDTDVVRRRVRHVVTETDRALEAARALREGDSDRFHKLMRQSHESLRDDYEVVTPELESAFQAAGRDGARMTGGGFGGSVIAWVNDPEPVAERIREAALSRGFPEPTFLVAEPGDGARRIG